ncbi:hypothetical protein BKA70DRAFT_1230862 [Coprinopsis sp. MPI-PUGE-AT-0042]|nr:hypothetical protein BKA70DRAFT_1230862 [Coprinopsis sp. MPI-PUGE-AT-0042]
MKGEILEYQTERQGTDKTAERDRPYLRNGWGSWFETCASGVCCPNDKQVTNIPMLSFPPILPAPSGTLKNIQEQWECFEDFRAPGAELIDIYFSPNSEREIGLPCSIHDGPLNTLINPFHKATKATLVAQPWKWSNEYGWTSFIPLEGVRGGHIWDILWSLPDICQVEDSSFGANPKHIAKLHDLEVVIEDTTRILMQHYSIPAVAPFKPSGFFLHRDKLTAGACCTAATLTYDWFDVWQGLLSYTIASSSCSWSHSPTPL